MTAKLSGKKRLEVIKRALRGEKIAQISRDVGISRTLLYRWKVRYEKDRKPSSLTPKNQKPKEWFLYPKLSPRDRYWMIERVKNGESVEKVCSELDVSRTLFYKWVKRYESAVEGKKLESLWDKKPEISKYYRQASPEYEEAVLSAVRHYPELSSHKLVWVLPQVGGRPILGNHGVQNVLRRHNLATYYARKAYADEKSKQSPAGSFLTLFRYVLSFITSLPGSERSIWVKSGFAVGGSIFALVILYGLQSLIRLIFGGPSFAYSTGITFSLISLLFGMFFFLYALKYYLTIAIVLSFSRQGLRQEEEYEQSSLIARIFNLENASMRKRIIHRMSGFIDEGGKGLNPDLSSVQLLRKPFVSIHLATYNEKRVVDRLLTAATSMDYENYEVIIVDDSTDETIEVLKKWENHPRVKIIHRANRYGYKGGGLATALKVMDRRTEFILVFDADFIPYPDTVEQFLKYFQDIIGSLEKKDVQKSKIAAVQGYQWHVLNKSENWITRGVRSEYAGSYVVERSGEEIYSGLKQISGSVYMIRADAMKQIGWGTSITEDFELTLKLYELGYKVVYTPYIQAPAEAVSTIKRLIRQRMRWAEGHSHNVKKMFKRLLLSSNLTRSEKAEFVYLTPYYLQALFFMIGTFCWFVAEIVFQVRLPFWTEVWGWSLIFTNICALPLMNLVGLFLEESDEKDYLGLFSFVALSYILAPFQAYAALKGFLAKEEGPWFRTPKTGRITDVFTPGRLYRYVFGLFGGRQYLPALSHLTPQFAFSSAQFNHSVRTMRVFARTFTVILLTFSLLISSMAAGIPLSSNSEYIEDGKSRFSLVPQSQQAHAREMNTSVSKESDKDKPIIGLTSQNPQKNPELFFLEKAQVVELLGKTPQEQGYSQGYVSKLPQMKTIKKSNGSLGQFLPYVYYKTAKGHHVLMRTAKGIERYNFRSDTLNVELLEKEKEKNFVSEATSRPIFQYEHKKQWMPYVLNSVVGYNIEKQTDSITLTQRAIAQTAEHTSAQIEIAWKFGIINNETTFKTTFRLNDKDHTNRMIWHIELADKEKKLISENNPDVRSGPHKEPVSLISLGNIEINWFDFHGPTRAALSASDQAVRVFFYEQGRHGGFEIDPTFTTTVGSTLIEIDDGTRLWCFGRGASSTANSFWQPGRFHHDSVSAPTNCTTGGDNLVSGANNSWDFIWGSNASIGDSASNTVRLLETSPSRALVQTFLNGTNDNFGKFTVYPNGYGYFRYDLGTLVTNSGGTDLGVHWSGANAPTYDRDATNNSYVISDTSPNNRYAGVHFIPFTLFGVNSNCNTYQNQTDDLNEWYGDGLCTTVNTLRHNTSFNFLVDFSTYRATTTTRDTRRTDYQNPDNLSDGLSNGVLWDDIGEQGYFWTGFEGADTDLCGGGDGWDTGSCNADDTAVGNSSTTFLGSNAAFFDGGATGTDIAYAQETVATGPRYAIRFALRIGTETLANNQEMTVASLITGSPLTASIQVRQNASGQLVLCVTAFDSVQTCGATVLSTATWYQVEFAAISNMVAAGEANYGNRAEVFLNGASEAVDSSVMSDNNGITTARVGLISSSTGNNDIYIDNVSINKTESGIVAFNPAEGAYSLQTNWSSDLTFDLDRSGKTGQDPVFKVRNWRSLSDPSSVTLEGTSQTDGTNFNADVLPFSESWINDSDGTCGTGGWAKLAEGGDDADTEEYLNDATNDFNFGSTSSCTWGDSTTDAFYLGRTDRFSGVNTNLATVGAGTPTVTWEYCSANTDLATTCDTWSSLTVTDDTSGASKFTASGNFYFTPPSQQIRSTENSGREALYYIRARVTAGSYTTYPVEDQIKSDILIFQYLGNVTADDQTFILVPENVAWLFVMLPVAVFIIKRRRK